MGYQNSWVLQQEVDTYLRSIDFSDSINGWAVGDQGKILFTADGENWQVQIPPTTNYLSSVNFIDSNTVMCFTSYNR